MDIKTMAWRARAVLYGIALPSVLVGYSQGCGLLNESSDIAVALGWLVIVTLTAVLFVTARREIACARRSSFWQRWQ